MKVRFRTMLLAITMAAVAAAGLHAQAGQPADGQKPAPKPHDMTGCLAKGDTATTYRLTDVEGGKVKTVEITEAAASLKLDGHVGHKVTITGVGVPAPKDKAAGHYMKIDAMKHVAPKCP
jgi:hypothetical protein